MKPVTDEQVRELRAAKAAAHNIRTTLQNAIAANLPVSLIEAIRKLSIEIAAEVDVRTGDPE